MKGFTKDGKFRPTGNRKKSSLKKIDVTRKVSTSSGKVREKLTVDEANQQMGMAVQQHSELSESVTAYMLSHGIPIESIKEILHESVDKGSDNINHLHESGRLDVVSLKMKDKDMFREKKSILRTKHTNDIPAQENQLYKELTEVQNDIFFKVGSLRSAEWDSPTLKAQIDQLLNDGEVIYDELDKFEERHGTSEERKGEISTSMDKKTLDGVRK